MLAGIGGLPMAGNRERSRGQVIRLLGLAAALLGLTCSGACSGGMEPEQDLFQGALAWFPEPEIQARLAGVDP